MEKETKEIITTIRLSERQNAEVEAIAKKYKQESIASTIRMIIEDFVQQEKIREQ